MTNWPEKSAPRSSAPDGGASGAGAPARAGAPALDGMLAERARDGDQDAFRALYERYAPMVHAVLLAHGPRGEADDLMQEVFLSAWRGLHRLQHGAHVGGWLAVIARNRGKRAHLRARPRAVELDADPVLGPALEPADPSSERNRRADRDAGAEALTLLSRLPPAYRETLAMRLVEGLTGPEIAEATGMTHGSVRVNLSRGMTLYEELLRKQGWP
jgi:RNA polymerase sigma-70 factor (ECF subfamily)